MRNICIWVLLHCILMSLSAQPMEVRSFSGSLPKILSRKDDNNLSSISNSKNFPYRTVGRLDTGCTGTLIGPRHVLTAAHCVYSMDGDHYYDSLQFSPGRNGDIFPFGTIDFKSAHAPKGWTKDHDSDFDYAVIILQDPIGEKIGWLGYGVQENMDDLRIQIIGYPGDKTLGTMWSSMCHVFGAEPLWINYQCETVGGMSGSGVLEYISFNESYFIRGVHALGGPEFNSAVRLTKSSFNEIKGWVNQ